MDEPASYRSRCAVIGPTAPVEILRRRLYNEGDISLVITRPAPGGSVHGTKSALPCRCLRLRYICLPGHDQISPMQGLSVVASSA